MSVLNIEGSQKEIARSMNDALAIRKLTQARGEVFGIKFYYMIGDSITQSKHSDLLGAIEDKKLKNK